MPPVHYLTESSKTHPEMSYQPTLPDAMNQQNQHQSQSLVRVENHSPSNRNAEVTNPQNQNGRDPEYFAEPRAIHIGVVHVRSYIRKHISRPISIISLITSVINMFICAAILILSLIVLINFDKVKCGFENSLSIPSVTSLYGGLGLLVSIILVYLSVCPNKVISFILLFVVSSGVFITTPVLMYQLIQLNELSNISDTCRQSLYYDMQNSSMYSFFIRELEKSNNCCGYNDFDDNVMLKRLPCCRSGYNLEIVSNETFHSNHLMPSTKDCTSGDVQSKPRDGCWIAFLGSINSFISSLITIFGATYYLFGISMILVFVDAWIAFHTSLSRITTEQEIRL